MNNKIVEECMGCNLITEDTCKIWVCPEVRWKLGSCPSATHIGRKREIIQEKVRVGQQKQKKRAKK